MRSQLIMLYLGKWKALHKLDAKTPSAVIFFYYSHSLSQGHRSHPTHVEARWAVPSSLWGAWPRSLAPPLARALPSPAALPRSERRRKATRGGGAWRPPPSSGRDRRDVPCSGGGRQDGVCGEFRGPSKGGDSLRAIPSGIVGRGRRRGGQRRAGSTAGGAGRTWTTRSAATFPRHPVPGFIIVFRLGTPAPR